MGIGGMIIVLLGLWVYTRINKKPINKLVCMINSMCDSFENYINQLINSNKNYYKCSRSHNSYDDVSYQIDAKRQKEPDLIQEEYSTDNSTNIVKKCPQDVSSLIAIDLNNTNHEATKPSSNSYIGIRQNNEYNYTNRNEKCNNTAQDVFHSLFKRIISRLRKGINTNRGEPHWVLTVMRRRGMICLQEISTG